MPKLKTHKGVAKRFKVTGTGRVMRRKAAKSHLFTKTSSNKRKRSLKELIPVSDSDKRAIRTLLPYH